MPGWAWLGVIGGLSAIGLARDLRPGVRPDPGAAARRGRRTRPGAAFFALRVFLDEVVPGREAGRAEAAESERGRLAADLHAEVLPSLRRALAEAEGGGTVERLAADLRSAVDEVEAMLLARRSIVLEEMGLLAGLEWLAERTEDRSDVRVEILVEGGPAAPPGTGARAAAGRGAGGVPRRAARARQRRPARAGRLGGRRSSMPRATCGCGSRTTRRPADRRGRGREHGPARARGHARRGAGLRRGARRRAGRRRPRHGDRVPLGRLAGGRRPATTAAGPAAGRELQFPPAARLDGTPTDGRRRIAARGTRSARSPTGGPGSSLRPPGRSHPSRTTPPARGGTRRPGRSPRARRSGRAGSRPSSAPRPRRP